ncbi:alpha-hydroxy acid oxidase [Nonomuraea sp. JJY05]|uniref:alpha-hydroxy acid oxidase n=1 Tax=Nonomuraea sp. JJY05 TaxID=3350255 RepID=UPI00373E15EE
MRPRQILRTLGLTERRRHGSLSSCHDIEDLRAAARRRLPRAVFDYVDGGADSEITLTANRVAYERWRFLPRILIDVSEADLTGEVFGVRLPVPLGLAPTGYTRMTHPDGELAVAAAAAAYDLPYCLSTLATTSIEEVGGTGHDKLWFQLYVTKDRDLTRSLIDRAAKAGFQGLEVSVDTAVSGQRVRDLRNGLTIPPRLGPRALLDIAAHPRYWYGMLRAPELTFANVAGTAVAAGRTVADITARFDAALSWDDLADIRARWPGPLLLKGPIRPADAVRAVSMGVDGLHLSNHGGRQLDRCVPPLDLLPAVRRAVGGETVIVVDSGLRHGSDLAIALALGADLCMVGRPYLYGLAAGGRRGVERALELLTAELRRTLQLIGVTSIGELRAHGNAIIMEEHQSWTHAAF